MIPVNDVEMMEARVPGQSNPFQKKIQIATESLQRWLLVYLVAASDASSVYFQLLFVMYFYINFGRSRVPACPVTKRHSGP